MSPSAYVDPLRHALHYAKLNVTVLPDGQGARIGLKFSHRYHFRLYKQNEEVTLEAWALVGHEGKARVKKLKPDTINMILQGLQAKGFSHVQVVQ